MKRNGIRNPKWTRDELILALDVYFELSEPQMTAEEPRIIALSNLLNKLPIHDGRSQTATFRNPPGVSMKLRNFLSLDPSYPGVGLSKGGKLDEEIWEEYSEDREKLRATAQAIRDSYKELVQHLEVDSNDDEGDETRPEGRILVRVHRLRERDKTLVERKKQQVFRKFGKLSCEVCDFDFFQVYGELGYKFCECHHVVPLSSTAHKGRTSLADLAIVCANCHRMFHRSPRWLSVDDLKNLLSLEMER